MRRVVTEPQGRLLRGLIRVLAPPTTRHDRHLPPIVVESFESDDWASLTFAGQRHRVALVVGGATLDSLPTLERLDVAGVIVADARIVSAEAVATGVELTIAVMTVDDGP